MLGAFYLTFVTGLKKPKWNADEITRVGGTQAVGTLLDLLTEVSNPKQRTSLFGALIELLPQMKASNALHLTRGQRRTLYWSLQGRLDGSEGHYLTQVATYSAEGLKPPAGVAKPTFVG